MHVFDISSPIYYVSSDFERFQYLYVLSLIYYVLSAFAYLIYVFQFYVQVPGFICSKRRTREIDLLLPQLKVPADWSRPRELFTSTTGIKIADCLSLCGPLGAYVIGLTDIQNKFKKLFIQLLNGVIRPILLCSPADARLPALQTQLVFLFVVSWHFVGIFDKLCCIYYILSIFDWVGTSTGWTGVWTTHLLEHLDAPLLILSLGETNQAPREFPGTQPPDVRISSCVLEGLSSFLQNHHALSQEQHQDERCCAVLEVWRRWIMDGW